MICRGDAIDVETRVRLLQTEYDCECAAFIAAWQRGSSVAENICVMETAARGFACKLDSDAQAAMIIEGMLLDFVRRTLLPASLNLPH